MLGKEIYWHPHSVTRIDREAQYGHRGTVVWFTGLSGAGKSTIAHALERILFFSSCNTFVLDGDNVRHGLNSDLGFSREARIENIRRIGHVAKLFLDAGAITLTAFISPFRADRDWVRDLVGECNFFEIYCRCALETCIDRDVKGLYRKAQRGEIQDFTGVSSPYEPPLNPALTIDTDKSDIQECVQSVIELLRQREVISNKATELMPDAKTRSLAP